MASIGRGGRDPKKCDESRTNKGSISKYFASIVTSPYKQDVSCLLVGQKGTGKSYASLSIAYNTSLEIARVVGGKPEDYFNMNNVACIDPEMANDLMSRQVKNSVYIYDDIGIGWNARKWNTDENNKKNDVLQVNRLSECLAIYSVPNQFLLDKVPRSLVNHYAETDRQYFSNGFVTIKLFKPRTLFREGKVIQPYIDYDGNKFVLYTIPAPPIDLVKAYDKLRGEVTKRIIEDRMSDEPDAPKGESAIQTRMKNMQQRISDVLPRYREMEAQGIPKTKILKAIDVPMNTWKNWQDRGYV